MQFNWQKKGKVFDPRGRFDWMHAYSQVPTVLKKENRLRIFFTCRPQSDANGNFVSHTSYIDVDRKEPKTVLNINEQPILSLGDPGTFDEFGIHPTSVFSMDGKVYLFYTGWYRGATVPYQTWIGLAISRDGGDTFSKVSKGPVLGQSNQDPYLTNGAYVFEGQNKFYMIYASAHDWILEEDRYEPVYTLKLARSSNLVDWDILQDQLIEAKAQGECISRPTVVKHNGKYHLWYGYRTISGYRGGKNAYQIGYASSKDLINWQRKDTVSGIQLSEDGWDSEMMSYPDVIENEGKLVMFYNGNDFGRNGFGYAEMLLENYKF